MDDLYSKVSLPPDAKAYARRKGLKTLSGAGQDLWMRVNRQLTNPTRPKNKIYQVGQNAGLAPKPKVREAAERLVRRLLAS